MWLYVFTSLGHIHRMELMGHMVTVLLSPGGVYKSRITGSRGNSVFDHLMNCQNVF